MSKKQQKRSFGVTQHDVDIESMSDADLYRHLDDLRHERTVCARSDSASMLKQIECDICYTQRECGIRSSRHVAHEEFLDKEALRVKLLDEYESTLPDADLDNWELVKFIRQYRGPNAI